jgi:arginine deiminase
MAKMRERGVEVVELHKLLTETVDIPKLVRGRTASADHHMAGDRYGLAWCRCDQHLISGVAP